MHAVEEEDGWGLSVLALWDGHSDASGKPSCRLLSTVAHSPESVKGVHNPSVAGLQGPPPGCLLGGASLVHSSGRSHRGPCPEARDTWFDELYCGFRNGSEITASGPQTHSGRARLQSHTLNGGFCGVAVGLEEKCMCPAENKHIS